MLKKIGLPLMALAGVLMLSPYSAKAAVRVGVVVGAPCRPAPAYVAPAYVYPSVTWDRFGHRIVRRVRVHEWRARR